MNNDVIDLSKVFYHKQRHGIISMRAFLIAWSPLLATGSVGTGFSKRLGNHIHKVSASGSNPFSVATCPPLESPSLAATVFAFCHK